MRASVRERAWGHKAIVYILSLLYVRSYYKLPRVREAIFSYEVYKVLYCSYIPVLSISSREPSRSVQGESRCYCVDIPRSMGSTEKMQDLISAIEEIKGGWVASAMYGKHQEMFMQPPHVLVFSNQHPPLHMMSQDRWKIYKVRCLTLARLAKNS